ncbi:hypothetical protein QE372_005183 [Agrobacterium pusense]|uniref:hypothetical protein n=1 Tax=Agrobacterium pusense TaxID=648995 RepID=UPI00285EF2C2|nr:hypothetical protein [Agrobacterium pusense]MDR6192849.1 hypothetical protein [Agrobacterium pusense]
MPPDEKPDLTPVLEAVAERIHYAETRRSNFTVIAGVLLAGGVALLGLIAGKQMDAVMAYPLWASAVSFMILGIFLFVVYARQTNLYPWTSATSTWKWFYRDALPDQNAFSSKFISNIFVTTKERDRVQSEYNRQLPLFRQKISCLIDLEKDREQDEQQLYVLHLNEKYKNQYLTDLKKILNLGILVWLIASVLSLAVGANKDHRDQLPYISEWTSGKLLIRGKWLSHTTENGTEEILLNADVTNTGKTLSKFPQWGLTTNEGVKVPLKAVAQDDSSNVISGCSTQKFYIVLRPLGSFNADTASLHVISE